MYGKTSSDSINSHLVLLSTEQKNVLYELAVLKKNGVNTANFWLQHKSQFPQLDDNLRDELALQVFANSEIQYTAPKNSPVQFWMQTQLLTNWMFYLSAFIAICAIIALFKKYWNLLIDFLIKHLAPLFRFLFSPVLLTYELLVISIVCIFYGCKIEEFVLRTVIVHVGLCLLWSQSTAIFAQEYLLKRYVFKIENNFWDADPWQAVKTICLPALALTLALLYVLCNVPQDIFYNYEIVLSGIAAIYALPFWRFLEKYLYPVLFPFTSDRRDRSINSLGGCTVIAIVITVVLILQCNPLFYNSIAALISLLTLSFLILSLKSNYRIHFGNYYYLQFVTIIFLTAVFVFGFYFRLNEIIWFSLIGTSVYLVIKYFEILSFFSDWRRSVWAWKLLGVAVLLWLLAKGILYVSKIVFIK
ncbi:hypothetical protein C4F50_10690 [Flavobacterium sp. KB82]|uniref:DUF4271 domain-containing protein n=2 Tax=Flavobacterium hungaricum TaxID=2082725 RepID=A0ABR9TJ87_9FLAO|nr:hypothetical protein [Flavobacterium hungaricum]